MATPKQSFKTIDEYIRSFPDSVQQTLRTLRQTIKKELPEAEETISYNMPAFKIGRDYLIYFAGWKKHTSVYPFSSAMEMSIPEAASYKMSGKGTIQFPLDEPLPLELIKKIVQFRLKEHSEISSASAS